MEPPGACSEPPCRTGLPGLLLFEEMGNQEAIIAQELLAPGRCHLSYHLGTSYRLQSHGSPAKSVHTSDECPVSCLSTPLKLATGKRDADTAKLRHPACQQKEQRQQKHSSCFTSNFQMSDKGTCLAELKSYPLFSCKGSLGKYGSNSPAFTVEGALRHRRLSGYLPIISLQNILTSLL